MSLDKATVQHIARLARLKLPESALEAAVSELNNILTFVEQLNEVPTAEVEPMTSVVEMTLRMRPDAITEGGDPEPVLANAPESAHGYFVVPKVVE